MSKYRYYFDWQENVGYEEIPKLNVLNLKKVNLENSKKESKHNRICKCYFNNLYRKRYA